MENETWIPTHLVPPGGMKAWAEPNPKSPPMVSLAGGIEIEVIERKGSWARVYNGSEFCGWVDDRLLQRRPRFRPTHQVPAIGLRAWASPDPSSGVIASLAPGSLVQLTKRRGSWSKVRASNGWVGWVDHRLLEGGDPAVITAGDQYAGEREYRLRWTRMGGLLGGIAAIVAAFLRWEPALATDPSTAFGISLSFLLSYNNADGGPALGLLLLVLGAVGAASAFLPVPAWIPRLAGAGVLALGTVYLAQVLRIAYDLDAVGDYLDFVGVGPFAAIGAAIAILSSD